jgi:DNA-binding transcriptional ArsR family regulator
VTVFAEKLQLTPIMRRTPSVISGRSDLVHPSRSELDVVAVLSALGNPVRLRIVRELDGCDGERACGALHFGVSKSTASQHLKVLREAGVIEQRDEGMTRWTSLRREDLVARFPGLLDGALSGG